MTFPPTPIIGDLCYNADDGITYVYTGFAWTAGPAEAAWQYGDLLEFKDKTQTVTFIDHPTFMYVGDNEHGQERVEVICVHGPDAANGGWNVGEAVIRHRNLFQRVEEDA